VLPIESGRLDGAAAPILEGNAVLIRCIGRKGVRC